MAEMRAVNFRAAAHRKYLDGRGFDSVAVAHQLFIEFAEKIAAANGDAIVQREPQQKLDAVVEALGLAIEQRGKKLALVRNGAVLCEYSRRREIQKWIAKRLGAEPQK